jgi:hypothetical protein
MTRFWKKGRASPEGARLLRRIQFAAHGPGFELRLGTREELLKGCSLKLSTAKRLMRGANRPERPPAGTGEGTKG